MNIEDNKKKNDDLVKESAAYGFCAIFFISIAIISCAYLQEANEGMGIGFWVATFAMWLSIFFTIVIIISAVLRGAGYSGKRDKIDDIF